MPDECGHARACRASHPRATPRCVSHLPVRTPPSPPPGTRADYAPNATPPAGENPPRTPTRSLSRPRRASPRGPATPARSSTRLPPRHRQATYSATRHAPPPHPPRQPPTAGRHPHATLPASARSTPAPRPRKRHREHASVEYPDPDRQHESPPHPHPSTAATTQPHPAGWAELPQRTLQRRPRRASERTHPDCHPHPPSAATEFVVEVPDDASPQAVSHATAPPAQRDADKTGMLSTVSDRAAATPCLVRRGRSAPAHPGLDH